MTEEEKAKSTERMIHIRLEEDVHRNLRRLTAELNTTIQRLVAEVVDRTVNTSLAKARENMLRSIPDIDIESLADDIPPDDLRTSELRHLRTLKEDKMREAELQMKEAALRMEEMGHSLEEMQIRLEARTVQMRERMIEAEEKMIQWESTRMEPIPNSTDDNPDDLDARIEELTMELEKLKKHREQEQ